MTKTRSKAIKLYWNIAKERCPFHNEEMVNSFLEGFIDCAEYLLLQNTDLEKENAELKEIIENDVDKKIYVQLAKKAKLADVQKEQLTKAKEIIRDLLSWEERADYDYNEYDDIKRKAESILKEE